MTQKIKEAVRERDGHRCQDCGKHQSEFARKLDVHRPVKRGPYSMDNGVTLCHRCHSVRHGPERVITQDRKKLVVAVPKWLKGKCTASARREGRSLREEVSRLLKIGFGLSPDAEGPPEGWVP